jgi:hypothetical protein
MEKTSKVSPTVASVSRRNSLACLMISEHLGQGLYPVTVCQALFIAPCSHTTHFKVGKGFF